MTQPFAAPPSRDNATGRSGSSLCACLEWLLKEAGEGMASLSGASQYVDRDMVLAISAHLRGALAPQARHPHSNQQVYVRREQWQRGSGQLQGLRAGGGMQQDRCCWRLSGAQASAPT